MKNRVCSHTLRYSVQTNWTRWRCFIFHSLLLRFFFHRIEKKFFIPNVLIEFVWEWKLIFYTSGMFMICRCRHIDRQFWSLTMYFVGIRWKSCFEYLPTFVIFECICTFRISMWLRVFFENESSARVWEVKYLLRNEETIFFFVVVSGVRHFLGLDM